MKATDLPLLRSLSRPALSPDGSIAVVAVTRPDLAADAYVGQLWSFDTAGADANGSAEPRRLSRGFRDTAPQFSPGGTLLAFLRAQPSGPSQVFVMPASGGEPVQATDAKLGVSTFRWSPDGRRIAFLSRVAAPGRYGTIEGLDASAEAPRHLTSLKYKSNGIGYTVDRPTQLFVVAAPSVEDEPAYPVAASMTGAGHPAAVAPTATQLTFADGDVSAIAWAPGSERIAFIAALHDTHDTDLRSDVYEISAADGGDLRSLTAAHGNFGAAQLVYGGDGRLFFLAQDLGDTARDFVGAHTALYLVEAPGEAPRRLTDDRTIDLGDPGSDLTALESGAVLVHNRSRGAVQLLSVSPEGIIDTLVDGAHEVLGHAASGDTIAVTLSSPTSAGELAILSPHGLRLLSDFSAPLREASVISPRDLEVHARDGHPVHGWVVAPEGEGPHPVLLVIHGGPFAQFSVSLFDEAQVYADAGYAVVMCNPRGSAGYGYDHGRVIRQAMGTVDFTDVLDFLDGAIASDPRLDAARLGIMGGSYGGYLTAWTIAHDTRFAGAIVERGFLDPESFPGTSDIGSFFGQEYVGEERSLMRSQSPQAVVANVLTPTFVIHSEDDLRCPLGQAETYFAALRSGGVDAEMLIFPGENHELSRAGRPSHRVQRFDAILNWWARYLPSEKNHA